MHKQPQPPPAQRRTDYVQFASYGYFAGGALDHGVKLENNVAAVNVARAGAAAIGGQLALFKDVCVLYTFSGAFPIHLTNHTLNDGTAAGGNVADDDGSVHWLMQSTSSKAHDAYVPDSTGQLTAGLPFNAVYVMTDGSANVRKPYGSYVNGYVQTGNTGQDLAIVFP